MPNKLFTKVKPERLLSHKVEDQIYDAILKKVYIPGDRLPSEIELARIFGVSRTAVREALRMLSGRGMIQIRKGSGAYVTEIASSQVVDPLYTLLELKCGGESLHHIVQLRYMIEPEIAVLAAIHRTEENLEGMRGSIEFMKAVMDDTEAMIPFDIQFHELIWHATQNPVIYIVMEPIYKLMSKFIQSTFEYSPAPALAIERHETLLDCFVKKDRKRAFEVMKLHMQDGMEHIDIYYKKHVGEVTTE